MNYDLRDGFQLAGSKPMNTTALPWVARVMDERIPLPLVVDALIDEITKNWSPATHQAEPDWAALRKLDYDGEFDRLSEWIYGVFTKKPPGADVNGLFFGVMHPPVGEPPTVAFFVTGSKTYGLDPDWALNPDDYLPDNCVSDSPLLTEVYHIFLSGGDEVTGRAAGIEFNYQFACLVVAEWVCSSMRHQLIGLAPSRALYVGLDPWKGMTVATLRPERLGGFGSLMVIWRGRCAGRTAQAGWITATRQAANWHHERWNRLDANVSEGWGALAWLRGRSAPERPVVRWFEEELEGSIVVLDDLFAERGEFATEALRYRLPPEPVDPEKPDFLFLRLKRLEVRGVDFQIFDPRGLYPGGDRMSFVVLHSHEAPFLNGMVAQIDNHAFCRRSPFKAVSTADWLIQCPFVHVRDCFHEWVFLFLTWLRHFHAPGLVIRPEDEAARGDWLIPMFRDLEQRHGAKRAEEISLERMKLAFAVEADRCQAKFAGED